jgi:hypothetical protein
MEAIVRDRPEAPHKEGRDIKVEKVLNVNAYFLVIPILLVTAKEASLRACLPKRKFGRVSGRESRSYFSFIGCYHI